MKKNLNIKGMHCISCEIILDKEFKQIKGLNSYKINHKTGLLEIDYKDDKVIDEIIKTIEKNGFELIRENGYKKNKKLDLSILLQNIALYLAIAVALYLLSFINLNRFFPDTSSLNYGGAFLIGIIASLSTCLAVTGGIIIGFSRYVEKEKGILGHIKIQSYFQIGRILGFFILGGVLGQIGNIFSIGFGISSIFTFLIGFLLLYMGLNIIGLVPSITKFGVHLPKTFASKIENISNPKYAPVVGALTFFLPCGFTQTMQLIAISSGSFFGGAMIMMIFALGTAPVLFSVGLGSSYFKEKKYKILNKIIGSLLIFFGLFTITNAYNLVGFSSQKTIDEKEIELYKNQEMENVNISHNGYSTIPEKIELKAGGNYKIIITPTSNGLGCMSTQLIPKLDTKVSFVKKGVPIVYEIYDIKKGEYPIVCSAMGMGQGVIIAK